MLSSHILRNFKRFPMKPNIGKATFLGIQIARNHIPRNLDARSNMDFLIRNVTLKPYLLSFKVQANNVV